MYLYPPISYLHCAIIGKRFWNVLERLSIFSLDYICVKIICIRSYSGPHFPTFGLNTERYSVSLRVQSECGKMRTRITSNTDTFHSMCCSVMRVNYYYSTQSNRGISNFLADNFFFTISFNYFRRY